MSFFIGLRLCVALSGGKDSMALLHYFHTHEQEWQMELSALHCNHAMRGEQSDSDSAFVQEYCQKENIPLLLFHAEKGALKTEEQARAWRHLCFESGAFPLTLKNGKVWQGYDVIATAHHLNDNAETVLFRLARGTALAGACGIQESKLNKLRAEKSFHFFPANAQDYLPASDKISDKSSTTSDVITIIHPFLDVTREEIDEYIVKNNIPYVQDESNFTDTYTRNYIRHNVLPALEQAVPGATKAIHRFSRLAQDDEEYLFRQAKKLISERDTYGSFLFPCDEKVLFKRAAVYIIAKRFGKEDYTSEQLERLFNLQYAKNGKKFEFLGLTAIKEEKGIALVESELFRIETQGLPFSEYLDTECNRYAGQPFLVTREEYLEEDLQRAEMPSPYKILKFDVTKIPANAVVRFMQSGDKFCKFGGGTKNLGDYFTDLKIPVVARGHIPLVAVGSQVLVVGGIEIADSIKLTPSTSSANVRLLVCLNYRLSPAKHHL
jgi:tRNA(Ile)-lysidine synthase